MNPPTAAREKENPAGAPNAAETAGQSPKPSNDRSTQGKHERRKDQSGGKRSKRGIAAASEVTDPGGQVEGRDQKEGPGGAQGLKW